MLPDDEEHLRRLNSALVPLLEAELKAGNTVAETWRGWPHQESLYILLARPFMVPRKQLPEGIRAVDVDDPHYWKAEYRHDESGHVLACRFDLSRR